MVIVTLEIILLAMLASYMPSSRLSMRYSASASAWPAGLFARHDVTKLAPRMPSSTAAHVRTRTLARSFEDENTQLDTRHSSVL